MSEINFDDAIGAGTDSETDTSDEEETEYEERPYLNFTPTTAIRGNVIGLGFTGTLTADQNIRGANRSDGGDLVVTLENPTVEKGTLYEADGRSEEGGAIVRGDSEGEQYVDYKLVDESDELIEDSFGPDGKNGIEIDERSFISESIEDFREADGGTIEVFIGSSAGVAVGRALDIDPRNAYVRDGESTSGLVEKPIAAEVEGMDYSPANGDPYPRFASQPTLHPELEDEEIVLYKRFGERPSADFNRRHEGYAFLTHGEEDLSDWEDLTEVENGPDPQDAPERFTYLAEGEDWHGDQLGSSGGSSNDSSTDSSGGTGNADEGTDTSVFEEAVGPADDTQVADYEELGTQWQSFIDQAASHAADMDASEVSEAFSGDWTDLVDDFASDNGINERDPTVLLEVANNRL